MTRAHPLPMGSRPVPASARSLLLAGVLALAAVTPARASDPQPTPATVKATRGLATVDLPHYQPPAAYSVDLVITSPKANMVMKRYIDQGRIRTEMTGMEMDVVMIETGDEQGTMLTLMPQEKRAIKQSRKALQALMGDMAPEVSKAASGQDVAPPPDMQIEDVGDETLDGKTLRKLRITMPEGRSIGWFDKDTGAPVRMQGTVEGETSVIEWKNYKPGPQPGKLFEAPKGYDVTDMDEMVTKMREMGGSGQLKALMGGMGGMGGAKGMLGGVGGVGGAGGVNAMMGGMGQNFGESMGGGLGASLGGALGGPLGAMAGKYLGGRIGGMIGRKTAETLTPGK